MSMLDAMGASARDNLYKVNPDAKIDVFSRVARRRQLQCVSTKGWNGMFFISKKSADRGETA